MFVEESGAAGKRSGQKPNVAQELRLGKPDQRKDTLTERAGTLHRSNRRYQYYLFDCVSGHPRTLYSVVEDL